MEIALVLLALAGLVVVLAVVARRRRHEFGRDDMLRSGDGAERDAREVALSAGGRSAWMRFGGGGG